MYSDECKSKNVECVSKTVFRRIFVNDFDLRFIKKFECKICKEMKAGEKSMVASEKKRKALKREKKKHVRIIKKIKEDFLNCSANSL